MDKIDFHYTKAADHKTVMVSGMFGGLNVNGYLAVNFFIDYPLVPETITYEIDPKTGKTKEVSRNPAGNRQGREVLITTMMDHGTMKALHEWLGDKIVELEKANEEILRRQESLNKKK